MFVGLDLADGTQTIPHALVIVRIVLEGDWVLQIESGADADDLVALPDLVSFKHISVVPQCEVVDVVRWQIKRRLNQSEDVLSVAA